jgi:hypothetical protein
VSDHDEWDFKNSSSCFIFLARRQETDINYKEKWSEYPRLEKGERFGNIISKSGGPEPRICE